MLNFRTNSYLFQSGADVLATDKDIAAGNRTVFLSIALLLFAVILLGLMTYLIASKEKGAESVLRAFGVMLIITSAVFLVIAGYPANELTPVIGLLGTIAGYLLGKATEKPDKKNAAEKPLASASEGSEGAADRKNALAGSDDRSSSASIAVAMQDEAEVAAEATR